jgi:hypothetical protein
VLFFFPQIVLAVFFGPGYVPAAPVCRLFGMAMLPGAMVYVMMNFCLARGETRFILSMGAGVVVQVASLVMFHRHLNQVLFAIVAGGLCAMIPMALTLSRGLFPSRES